MWLQGLLGWGKGLTHSILQTTGLHFLSFQIPYSVIIDFLTAYGVLVPAAYGEASSHGLF